MKVIVDDKIPFIREALATLADEAVYVPGKDFTPELVRDADALIVRTRTRCDRRLLEGSRVRFIATATIGFDHIDTAFCQEAGITWQNAPGWLLQRQKDFRLEGKTLGVIGVGNVGTKVAQVGRELGMRVLLNDPPRQEKEGGNLFSPLKQLMEECDVLTFHVPLIREGVHKTFHLADADFFDRLKRRPVIANTSRGEVIETQALLHALQEGEVSDAIIDVWEHEPDICLDLLDRAFIGTPHIAGYSNATRMSLDALCRFFHLDARYRIEPPAPPQPLIEAHDLTEASLAMYDPRRDDQALRLHPECFEKLRGDYPLRREKEAFQVNYI